MSDIRSDRIPVVYVDPFDVKGNNARTVGSDAFLSTLGAGLGYNHLFAPTRLDKEFIDTHFGSGYRRALTSDPTVQRTLMQSEPDGTPDDRVHHFIDWSERALGAVLTAAKVASEYGLAIARCGGFHHATMTQPGNFSAYSDVLLAARLILRSNPDYKILIIDTDAHVADGLCSGIREFDGRVTVYDLHSDKFKNFIPPNPPSSYHPVSIPRDISDKDYLKHIHLMLATIAQNESPDFVIYLSGYDLLEEDIYGKMRLKGDTLIERDMMVFNSAKTIFSEARQKAAPFMMLPGGGYTNEADSVFGRSAREILNSFLSNPLP